MQQNPVIFNFQLMVKMIKISDLPIDKQDILRHTLNEYHVQTDPKTFKKYVRFMNEDVEYNSVKQTQLLNG